MQTTKQKIWTYEDYTKLDDDKRYEVIEGELIEMPAPSYTHQKILFKLARKIANYVEEKKCGEVCIAPLDTIFSEINTLQPDILFISQNKKNIIKERGIFGSPDLVVEILSSSNPDHDRVDKFKIYQKHKVKEYWIIDPEEHIIEVFALENNKLISFCNVRNEEKVKSKTFSGIDICFEDLIV